MLPNYFCFLCDFNCNEKLFFRTHIQQHCKKYTESEIIALFTLATHFQGLKPIPVHSNIIKPVSHVPLEPSYSQLEAYNPQIA